MDNSRKILIAVAAAAGVFISGLGIYYFSTRKTARTEVDQELLNDIKKIGEVRANA